MSRVNVKIDANSFVAVPEWFKVIICFRNNNVKLNPNSLTMFKVDSFEDVWVVDSSICVVTNLNNLNGEAKPLDERAVNQIYRSFMKNDYIDDNDNITDKLKEDIANDNVIVPEEFDNFKEEYVNLIKSLYTDIVVAIENVGKKNIRELKPNDNFNKQEFQDLWNKINIKTIYEVDFNTNELIEKAVNAINAKLNIAKM